MNQKIEVWNGHEIQKESEELKTISEKEKTPGEREQEKYVRIPVSAIHFNDPYQEAKWRNDLLAQEGWIDYLENMFRSGQTITVNL